MTTTQLALDKKANPLMMHLSILPKYGISVEETFSYDPSTQTSNITSMSGSWCTRSSSSTEGTWPFTTSDDDTQEDD
ncbi:hypothetical protein [Microcoleus sp. bin38.metabat.b11b12b14.051]|uniref:hypothetical protein n=1 Tax=Microcoleus sp. bin38.metabat.b11b12b14.051 TaxID=2742709 RepID=UPI0025D5A95D|nr:hypothetical protein [Microcoleus sp. bin38.metabat.b11b12b14.051]